MSPENLIEWLEHILPGLENSNSAAEDAMIEALPRVIDEMNRLMVLAKNVEQQNRAQAEQISEWKQRLATSEIHGAKDRREAERLKAERDLMAEALKKLANEASGLKAFEHEVRQVISNTNWECLRLRVDEARKALESSK